MHRLIVTSATYRQSSRARPDLAEIDPDNRLLARQIAPAAGRRDHPRRGAGGERPADAGRSAARASFRRSPEGVMARDAGEARVADRDRAGPLPPRHVHLLLALRAASRR